MSQPDLILLTMTREAAHFYVNLLEDYQAQNLANRGVEDKGVAQDLDFLYAEIERKGWSENR